MILGVIGYGRFGELWAHMLANDGHTVIVYDKEPVMSDHERITVTTIERVVRVSNLFLCVPISGMEAACRAIAPLLPKETTVIDLCSVKIYPASIMRRFLSPTQPLIGAHPLFGPDSVARQGAAGQGMVVCPLRMSERNGRQFEALLQSLKLNIQYSTAEAHDRAMAGSQALVHFIGRGLSELHLRENTISTPDYQSLLKMNSMVENDTWQLFYDLERYNPFAKDVRRTFLEQLQRLERTIVDEYERPRDVAQHGSRNRQKNSEDARGKIFVDS